MYRLNLTLDFGEVGIFIEPVRRTTATSPNLSRKPKLKNGQTSRPNESSARLIERFAKLRVLVAGDLILDHYLHGSVLRISPEAPVPVLNVEREGYLLGGAANVARNLSSLGARVELVGLRGKDDFGDRLERLISADELIRAKLVTDPSRPTTLKTRCIANGQQMMRLDREAPEPVSGRTEERVIAALLSRLSMCDAVIVSDYAKGLLSKRVLEELIAHAREAGKPLFVDPKGDEYRRYRGATYLTPNQKEAQEATGVKITDEDSLRRAGRALLKQVSAEAVFITRGPKGVSVFPRIGQPIHMPARAREVFDVTGAGDTFIAVSALAVAGGGSLADAATLANAAAGVVVAHAGVAAVKLSELRKALDDTLTAQGPHR
jgi:D-beta-D-heptose 7-phosphate kinase/D-beta-D-heptose 1-phosphate adenosyltransferase